MNPSLIEKIKLRLFGRVPIGLRTRPGWKGSLMFYLFRCPHHGLVEGYEHGHYDRLDCPLCNFSMKFKVPL